MPELSPRENVDEVTEGGLLGGKLRYRQFATGHRSGFEPVLLSASVAAKPGERVLEAGTGAGAALLCLAHRVPGVAATGAEIATDLAELANQNFSINGLNTISCICSPIEQAGFGAVFDHAMANPPWHAGTSTKSPDAKRALAHHTQAGLLANWIKALAGCLKPRGSLTLILPAENHFDATAHLRQHGLGSVRLFPLWPRAGQPAKMVIIAATLGARGPDRILPGLVLHDPAGITPAAQAILRDGAPIVLNY